MKYPKTLQLVLRQKTCHWVSCNIYTILRLIMHQDCPFIVTRWKECRLTGASSPPSNLGVMQHQHHHRQQHQHESRHRSKGPAQPNTHSTGRDSVSLSRISHQTKKASRGDEVKSGGETQKDAGPRLISPFSSLLRTFSDLRKGLAARSRGGTTFGVIHSPRISMACSPQAVGLPPPPWGSATASSAYHYCYARATTPSTLVSLRILESGSSFIGAGHAGRPPRPRASPRNQSVIAAIWKEDNTCIHATGRAETCRDMGLLRPGHHPLALCP